MGLLKSYQSLANLERYQGNSSSLTLLNVSQERVQNWCLHFSSKSLKMEKLCQVTLSSLFNSDTQPCQSAPQKNLHYLKHKLPNFYSFTLFPPHFLHSARLLVAFISLVSLSVQIICLCLRTRNGILILLWHSVMKSTEFGGKLNRNIPTLKHCDFTYQFWYLMMKWLKRL